MRRPLTLAAVALTAFALATPAYAEWTVSTTAGKASATGASLQAPATAKAAATTGDTSSSITVTWTAPSSGPAPTSYTVQRVSASGTALSNPLAVCTVKSTDPFACTDSALKASTAYGYSVTASISNWNGTEQSASTSTTADTTAPTVAFSCPSSNAASYTKNTVNNKTGVTTYGTWNTSCGEKVKFTVTDASGVNSVKVAVAQGSKWLSADGGTMNSNNRVDIPVSAVSGSSYQLSVPDSEINKGGTVTVYVTAVDKAATPNTATPSITFTDS